MNQKYFLVTDDGFSLISGFTKKLCSPENPLQKQKQNGKNVDYKMFALQPYFRPRKNIKLEEQREILALRTKMNHIRAIFVLLRI